MTITIASTSINEDLYSIHLEFLKSLPAVFSKTRTDHAYWIKMIERFSFDTDYIIWIDDDVFITRPQSILDMIKYMIDNSIDYLGMPEKGYSGHRSKNPGGENSLCAFFVIFKTSSIRKITLNEASLLEYYKRIGLEPHYSLFSYLEAQGLKRGIFTGRDHADNITTIITDTNGIDFGFHTWYSRSWKRDSDEEREVKDNTRRMINIIEEAKQLCQK